MLFKFKDFVARGNIQQISCMHTPDRTVFALWAYSALPGNVTIIFNRH